MTDACGFALSESCPSCALRRAGFFCQLTPAELRDFDAAKYISGYPAGAVLCEEEQKCRGIFVVCRGEVKLTISTNSGRTLILRIAEAGEVLGLEPALSGGVYEATAETLGPCQVAFVPLRNFQSLLREHPKVMARVASQLGLQYRKTCGHLRVIALGASTLEKVARFLLAWSASRGGEGDGWPFTLALSHEEIAQFLGTTRESVTRALVMLVKRGLIDRRGARIVIPSRVALQEARTRQRVYRRPGPQLVTLNLAIPRRRSARAGGPNGDKHMVRKVLGGDT